MKEKTMNNKVYVGNLSLNATKEDLQQLFAAAGVIEDVAVIKDRDTGRSKGFAFVTFATRQEAQEAVTRFNGQEFMSRPLKVDIAQDRERPQRRMGSGGGAGRGRDSGGGRRRF